MFTNGFKKKKKSKFKSYSFDYAKIINNTNLHPGKRGFNLPMHYFWQNTIWVMKSVVHKSFEVIY